MLELRKLTICGLEYQVILAAADEVPELEDNEGYTSALKGAIYIRSTTPPARMRDTLMHEVTHAFLEGSGLGHFIKENFGASDAEYDKFEETLIRLAVPHVLRLVGDNGDALIDTPAVAARPGLVKAPATRGKAKKGARR